MSRVVEVLAAGIDLSGRTTGTTALAWLTGTTTCERPCLDRPVVTEGLRGVGGDERIASLVVDGRPDVVAIDAPLHLPHAVMCRDGSCKRCFPPDGASPSYTTRKLERKERWSEPLSARPPMPMVMVVGIAFRAIFLRRLLEREGIRVIETWPAGVFRRIQDAPWCASPLDAATRAGLLLGCVDDPDQQFQRSDLPLDALDAVAAALAAWAYATNWFQPIKNEEWLDEGAIILPQIAPS